MADRRLVEFERLNLLGKVVYSGGLLAAATVKAVDFAVRKTSSIVEDAERAFREGLRDDVDDARVIEEEITRRRDTPIADPPITVHPRRNTSVRNDEAGP